MDQPPTSIKSNSRWNKETTSTRKFSGFM